MSTYSYMECSRFLTGKIVGKSLLFCYFSHYLHKPIWSSLHVQLPYVEVRPGSTLEMFHSKIIENIKIYYDRPIFSLGWIDLSERWRSKWILIINNSMSPTYVLQIINCPLWVTACKIRITPGGWCYSYFRPHIYKTYFWPSGPPTPGF